MVEERGGGISAQIFCSAVKGVLDLPENQEVVIIGTLYKEMKLKPSILAEYTKAPFLPCTPPFLLRRAAKDVKMIQYRSSLWEKGFSSVTCLL